jgi:hypothetical protein
MHRDGPLAQVILLLTVPIVLLLYYLGLTFYTHLFLSYVRSDFDWA